MLKRLLLSALTVVALLGCAAGGGQRQVFHSFDFHGWNDGWYSGPKSNVQLQEYSYGDQYRMVRDQVKAGDEFLPPTTSVSGSMPIGEFLYVRWRLKDSGEMIEHRVDLRDRLPWNMHNKRVTFVIDGKKLYVYLVTDQGKEYGTPPLNRAWRSNMYVTYEIYPTRHQF